MIYCTYVKRLAGRRPVCVWRASLPRGPMMTTLVILLGLPATITALAAGGSKPHIVMVLQVRV